MVPHPGKKQADKTDFFRLVLSNRGPDDSTKIVHDYANKEWSGMTKHFYFPPNRTSMDRYNYRLLQGLTS